MNLMMNLMERALISIKKLGVKCMGVWLDFEGLLDEQTIRNEAARVKVLVKENLNYSFDDEE